MTDSGIDVNSTHWLLHLNKKKKTRKNKRVTVLWQLRGNTLPHVTRLCTTDTNLPCLIAATEYDPSEKKVSIPVLSLCYCGSIRRLQFHKAVLSHLSIPAAEFTGSIGSSIATVVTRRWARGEAEAGFCT